MDYKTIFFGGNVFVVKKLVQGLIQFVENGEFPFKPGILRDGNGEPILDITSLLRAEVENTQAMAKSLLDSAATGNFEGLDAQINSFGKLDFSLFSYPDGPAIMVPCINDSGQVPFAVLALARMANTGSGDSVAHRIAKCEWCGKFFLRKTKKKSRFHSRACRIKHMNKERLRSGWFKSYYLRKKIEKNVNL